MLRNLIALIALLLSVAVPASAQVGARMFRQPACALRASRGTTLGTAEAVPYTIRD